MTPKAQPEIPTIVSEALRASGFPFQIAVADLVKRAPGWRVLDEEWPWQESTGQDRFLDLVAEKGRTTLCVETKKTDEGIYTFISHPPEQSGTNRWRGLVLVKGDERARPWSIDYSTWAAAPQSGAGSFCVVSPKGGPNERLLETTAQMLLRGTCAFALRYPGRFQSAGLDASRAFISVLVTNARLFVTQFARESVALDTGRLRPGEKTAPVDWFRFSKPFLTNPSLDLGEQTVFVVRAEKLGEFLDSIEMIGGRGTHDNVRFAGY